MSRNGVLLVVAASLAVALWVTAMWGSGDRSSSDFYDVAANDEPAAPEAPQAAAPPALEPDPEPEPEPEQPAPTAVVTAPAPVEEQPAPGIGVMPPPTEDGPLEELRSQFEREPRASSAHELESLAKMAFDNPNVDPKLFDSVLCRETVCRVRMHWRSERMIGFMAALTILRTHFAPVHAVSPAKADDADGSRALEVYIRTRRPDDPPAFPTAPATEPTPAPH
jgi:hypothetical protein